MMTEASPVRNKETFGYEIALSLTVALGFTGVLLAQGLAIWPFKVIKGFLTSPHDTGGRQLLVSEASFICTALIYATCMFVVCRVLNRATAPNVFRTISGIVVFAVPLVSWVLMLPGRPTGVVALLALETLLCIATIYYLLQKSGRVTPHVVFILIVHNILWLGLFWVGVFSHAATLIPVFATTASVLWVSRGRPGVRQPDIPTQRNSL